MKIYSFFLKEDPKVTSDLLLFEKIEFSFKNILLNKNVEINQNKKKILHQ